MQDEYQNYGGQGYYDSGNVDPGALAALAAFGVFFLLLAVALYAVNAIFLTKILKNAGHKSPIAAWVPVWNMAALMDVGGIKQPWIWTLVIFAGSVIGGSIPGIGFILSLAVFVASVIVTIWLARGLQGALRTGGTGGIVLAVLVPIAWVIWMGVVSGRNRYDRGTALREGDSMPMNWFGSGDRNASFPGEAAQGSWNANPGYGNQPPQAAPYGYQQSSAPQPGGQPFSDRVPPAPAQWSGAEQGAYPTQHEEERSGFSLPPIVSHEQNSGAERDGSDTPAPLPLRESPENGQDGNQPR